MTAREILIDLYMDYLNNYLTVERFAEHNGLTHRQATYLLLIAHEVALTPHPEA